MLCEFSSSCEEEWAGGKLGAVSVMGEWLRRDSVLSLLFLSDRKTDVCSLFRFRNSFV